MIDLIDCNKKGVTREVMLKNTDLLLSLSTNFFLNFEI